MSAEGQKVCGVRSLIDCEPDPAPTSHCGRPTAPPACRGCQSADPRSADLPPVPARGCLTEASALPPAADPDLYFCRSGPNAAIGVFVFMMVWMLLLFVVLATTADDYFAPVPPLPPPSPALCGWIALSVVWG